MQSASSNYTARSGLGRIRATSSHTIDTGLKLATLRDKVTHTGPGTDPPTAAPIHPDGGRSADKEWFIPVFGGHSPGVFAV